MYRFLFWNIQFYVLICTGITKYVKLSFSSTEEKIAGVIEVLHFKEISSEFITFKPSKRYLTLKAIWSISPSIFTGYDSDPLPISWASAIIFTDLDDVSVVIFTILLCWSARTATRSKEEIKSFLLKTIVFEKESGISWL